MSYFKDDEDEENNLKQNNSKNFSPTKEMSYLEKLIKEREQR